MLWKKYGKCSTECGIPLHLAMMMVTVRHAHRPRPPLTSCSLQSPCIRHFYQLKATVKPKVASPLLMLSTFFFSPFSPLHVLCQLTSHLQLHKAFGTTFISLITCVCQLHIWPSTQLLSPYQTHTYTHHGAAVLRQL